MIYKTIVSIGTIIYINIITLLLHNLELIEIYYRMRSKNNFTIINLNGFRLKQLIG